MGEPANETEKCVRRNSGSFASHITKSACMLCWAFSLLWKSQGTTAEFHRAAVEQLKNRRWLRLSALGAITNASGEIMRETTISRMTNVSGLQIAIQRGYVLALNATRNPNHNELITMPSSAGIAKPRRAAEKLASRSVKTADEDAAALACACNVSPTKTNVE